MELIKLFDPWKSKLCSCRPKYSLSAYTGCGHGCLYCYASSYIPRFYLPRIKKDFIKRLEKEVNKIPKNSIIAISNSSDPYQPIEEEEKLTRKTLEILKNFDLKVNLITKSDLILGDLKLLKKIKKILVAISITSIDGNLSKKIEPNCPTSLERLKAIQILSKAIPVVVRFDPLIYPINTKNTEEIIRKIKKAGAKQVITSTYKLKPDNFKRMIKIFPQYLKLWEKLYYQEGFKKNNPAYLKKSLRKTLIEKIKKESLAAGLEFSSCREDFEKLNTSICDGTNFL